MKRAVVLVLATVLLVSAMPICHADIGTAGIAVIFSVGDEKHQIRGTLTFLDEKGNPITPCGNMLSPPTCQSVYAQLFIPGLKNPKDYTVEWTTASTVEKCNLKKANYTTCYHYTFELKPEDIAKYPGDKAQCLPPALRALQVAITDKHGRKSWLRAIIKITYGSGPLTDYTLVVMNPTDSSQMAGGGASADQINTELQKTAAYVTKLNDRMTNVEGYLGVLSSGSSGLSKKVTLPLRFKGTFAQLGMRFIDLNGQLVEKCLLNSPTGQSISVPCGTYRVDCLIDYGGNQYRPRTFSGVVVSENLKSLGFNVEGGSGQ